ncbi:hypothetical protein [Campylobacter concisus]|nr:hypothetical protein [Campylobacter concisus]
MFYKSDKELFGRIYGEDYEKFKEVFEDTLKLCADTLFRSRAKWY